MERGYIVLLMVLIIATGRGEGQLVENFYSSSCPNVEGIVSQAVSTKFSQTFTTIPATLRLFFHDCFVTGCDASTMVSSPNGDAEKDAPDNLSLAGDGFDTVVKAKQAVDAVCPKVVSCADILALAARDVVVLPEFTLSQLNAMFAKHNLSQIDMIALSGAHTLGFSHCNRFANRLYSFSSSSPVDPSLNSDYAQQLMSACPKDVDPSIAIDMDPVTPRTFDNVYYQNLVSGKGLFTSDEVLFSDPASQPTVSDFAQSSGDFSGAFATAMRKLGRVGVKTGSQGSIRTDCTVIGS
uniref:Peroxidase n=1 Tax=Salix viminalis TaxID=40686 RepID=A0A6N2L9M1_SALVM